LELVADPERVEDGFEGGLAHGNLPVWEQIVGVAVLLDARHLAAEETVLLDEQGVDAPLLKERGAGKSAGSTADHDGVVRRFGHGLAPLFFQQLFHGTEQPMVFFAVHDHRVQQDAEQRIAFAGKPGFGAPTRVDRFELVFPKYLGQAEQLGPIGIRRNGTLLFRGSLSHPLRQGA